MLRAALQRAAMFNKIFSSTLSVLLTSTLVFTGFTPLNVSAAAKAAITAVPAAAKQAAQPPAAPQKQAAKAQAATGTFQLHLFEDKDGNGTYSPWPPEGDTFAGTSYGLGQFVGDTLQPVPAKRCSGNGFKVDTTGSATCNLDEGSYATNVPNPGTNFLGPIKGPNNTSGSNPMLFTVTAGKTTTIDFGFIKKIPQVNKGNIHINAYVDTNWN